MGDWGSVEKEVSKWGVARGCRLNHPAISSLGSARALTEAHECIGTLTRMNWIAGDGLSPLTVQKT